MTRFKDLARIQQAIASQDGDEVQWALTYCRSRLDIAATSPQRRYWRRLIRELENTPSRKPHDPYLCGLKPGERVRLRKDLVVRYGRGSKRPSKVHTAGEIWKVLPGSCSVADDVWFETPDGEPHTWGDDATLYEWFERV
jgi:hypothetical protein